MEYKLKGDRFFEEGNYKKYLENYKEYHNIERSQTSQKHYENAKKKYELYNEIQQFLKKDENDYYNLLGVKSDATQKQIRDAYTKLITKFHPDRTKIKESNIVSRNIQRAYTVLSNNNEREKYDYSRRKFKNTNVFRSNSENEVYNNMFNQFAYTSFMTGDTSFHIYNDFDMLNNLLYRSFLRQPRRSNIRRERWDHQNYIKISIFFFIFIFLLFN